ncbi:MAG TPA: nucleoside-diphosphate sugar epimerase/dehydratase, partial [Thermoanaerobaculia bacterium]
MLILAFFHAFVFASCYVFATFVRFEFTMGPPGYAELFRMSFPMVVCVHLLVGAFFGFYRGWWRYVGIADVLRLVGGLTTSLAILLVLWYFGPADQVAGTFRLKGLSRGVLLINCAFTTLTLFGARVLVRLMKDRTREDSVPRRQLKRVFIIGAGDAGEMLAREIEHRPQLGMKVVAFVDDQRAKWHSNIRGIEVRGPISEIAAIASELGANEALIAIPSASGPRIREIIHHLAEAELKFKTMPGIDQLMSGKVHVTQLRPVNVEDLLRREKIELPGDPVRQLFRGKRVLITGAGGTIGSELASQVLGFEPEHVWLVERSEFALYECRRRLTKERGWMTSVMSTHLADIRDESTMTSLVTNGAPDIVLHAAAHKHVPLGEDNPPEYVRNNCLATRRFAEICSKAGVERFVFISTDKAINPTSVMGATKRAAEIALLDLARTSAMKLTIVRFGNVIGSSGSVVPLFLEQIAQGGPVTVTHPEVTRYFLRTSEAISLVLQAASLGDGGRVFMLDMGEPVRIIDLARDLIQLANQSEREIPILITGMRPGEKLFEEIRLDGEFVHPTDHPQIVITETPQPTTEVVAECLWLL